jgi:tRNA 2-selenouridine synthase
VTGGEAALGEVPGDLRAALFAGSPIIDVRAPVEFAQGALPASINLPLLDDAQRAAVGTLYKREGQEAAIALGRELVDGADREAKSSAWLAAARARPGAWLCCLRGGLRSQLAQRELRQLGVDLPLLEGGYKRARRFLLEAIERASARERFAVIGGFTGCGKTQLIEGLGPSRRALDLEALARHRGSAFGGRREPQPAQATFENSLALALWRAAESPASGAILLEDESRLIGRNELPAALFARLSAAPLFVLEKPIEARARALVETYLVDYGLARAQLAGELPPAAALGALGADLRRAIYAIERRLGGAETRAVAELAEAALEAHRREGRTEAHDAWATRLLRSYYDPLYQRHLQKMESRIVARGDEASIRAALEAEAR